MKTTDCLRDRLRRDTGPLHDRLDRSLSACDLTDPDGLIRYLRLQVEGFGALEIGLLPNPLAEALTDTLERARVDLAVLGHAPGPVTAGIAVHGLAARYLFAGSRLGNAVLRRRWASAADLRVRRASAYFSAPDRPDLWRGFCATATALPASSAVSDRIVADAIALFDHFLRLAEPVPAKDALHHV